MLVKINPKTLSGVVVAPPSKSYAHRLIISAFLSGGKVTIKNIGASNDVIATITALKSLGANIVTGDNFVTVNGRSEVKGKVTVNCLESGSTLRFLMPIACALGINAEFTGQGRLLKRPITDLASALNLGGATVNGFTVSGKLKAGVYNINASVSSQYVTGLIFALSALDGDSYLNLVGNVVSSGYIDITIDVLKTFGVNIIKTENGYYIKGGQYNIAPNEITVEGDFSGSAFILSLGAINGEISVSGLNKNTKQGDVEIVSVLKKFGAMVTENDGVFTVKNGNLKAITLDCENIPDLVQVIASVASYAEGVTVLKNVDRLRIKESDRIEAVINTLKTAGIKAWYQNGNLYVEGGKPVGGIFDGGNDHRTVMSAVVLSAFAKGNSVVTGAEAHKKSYPEYFEHLKLLGGDIDVEI